MAETLELITIKQICELLKISRNTFYLNYKGKVTQIPTITKELKFDKQSVLDRAEKLKQEKKS